MLICICYHYTNDSGIYFQGTWRASSAKAVQVHATKKPLQEQQQYFALIQHFTFWKPIVTRLLFFLIRECFKEFLKILGVSIFLIFLFYVKGRNHLSPWLWRQPFPQQRAIQGREGSLRFLCVDANASMWLQSVGSQGIFMGQCHFQVSPACQVSIYNSAFCFMLVTAWPVFKAL